MSTEPDFRTIQSIGRTALINELTENTGVRHKHVLQGVGDDAAVLQASDRELVLFTSETFMEGVDFDLTYTPLHHLGYKVLSTTVSDIYAMNGRPLVALVNLAVPNKLSVDMLKQIYKGVYAAGNDFDVQIAGGDLTASHQTLSISLSCMGETNKEQLTYRKGAKEGDLICLSGDLGGAIAGLRILMREKKYWQEEENQLAAFEPDLKGYEYVIKRQLAPAARKDLIDIFWQNNITPHAMIDITQGLVNELQQVALGSQAGARIYQAALPIAPDTRKVADEMQEEVDKYALYGGEDLELLFTLSEHEVEMLDEVFDDVNVIGKMVSSDISLTMKTANGDVVEFSQNN